MNSGSTAAGPIPPESEGDQISQNIGAVQDFYTREHQKISHPQALLEGLSHFVGKPIYVLVLLLFVALWILVNTALPRFGLAALDRAPFPWLQGMISLCALLTATAVLTEQKAAKLIDLLEELRRDLPNVRNRHDPGAASLQQPMNPDHVLAALGAGVEPDQKPS